MSATGCACKRGFLVLRDCGNSAQGVCPSCGRGICAEHFAADLNMCVECAARQAQDMGLMKSEHRYTNPSRAAARIRRVHYDRHRYHPFLFGYPSGYYDAYDINALDDSVAPDWEPDAGPSYYDS